MTMVKCCVLIPYFNDGIALLSSLESLKDNQIEFDIIVIDDGSTKQKAREVLKGYKERVKLIELTANRGIEHALNEGLMACYEKYDYIARLDCGDICMAGRLDKQVAYLEKNPNCYLLGSWVTFVDMTGRFLFLLQHPEKSLDIKNRMFINCAFTHPSVMFRSNVFSKVGFYPLEYPAAEDYALFFKIVRNFDAANLPEVLVSCVINPTGISVLKRKEQIKSRIKIIKDNFILNRFSIYGLIRSYIMLAVPRGVSVYLNKVKGMFF